MTNADRATFYRSLAVIYDRLAALDSRQVKVDAAKSEQAQIDAARKQVLAELDELAKIDTTPIPVPSIIPIPPAQPPVSPALARSSTPIN